MNKVNSARAMEMDVQCSAKPLFREPRSEVSFGLAPGVTKVE